MIDYLILTEFSLLIFSFDWNKICFFKKK